MKGVVDLIRGACEQFKFKIPYTWDQITKVEVIFKQKKHDGTTEIITKNKGNCQTGGAESKNVYVELNEEETLRFSTDAKVELQWRALTTDGDVFSSRIKKITVYPTLSETRLS